MSDFHRAMQFLLCATIFVVVVLLLNRNSERDCAARGGNKIIQGQCYHLKEIP